MCTVEADKRVLVSELRRQRAHFFLFCKLLRQRLGFRDGKAVKSAKKLHPLIRMTSENGDDIYEKSEMSTINEMCRDFRHYI